MTCNQCQQSVSDDITLCPHCGADLVDVTVGEEAAPDRSTRPGWLVFGGVALAVLAVGLTAWAIVRPSAVQASWVDRFPSDAVFYTEINVAELASADSRRIVEAFAPLVESETGEPFDIDTIIEETLATFDSEFGEHDVSFEEDIASWATGPIAIGIMGVPGTDPAEIERAGILIGGDNADALDAFLAKVAGFEEVETDGTVELGSVSFQRFTTTNDGDSLLVGRDDTDLIIATDEATATALADPVEGSTLADVSEVSAQMEQLPGNAAAVFVVNGSDIGDVFGVAGTSVAGWTTGALTTDREGLRFDYVADLGDSPAPSFSDELTAALPADTVAFLRVGSLLDQVTALAESPMVGGVADSLEEETGVSVDDLAAVFSEDGAIAIWPSTDPELPVNGAVVGVSDTPQTALVDRLADLAGTMGLMPTPVDAGYSFNGLATLGTRGDLTLLTTDGDLIASAPAESFQSGTLYRRAAELVDGELMFAVDMRAIIDLVDGFVGMDDPEAAERLRCLPLGVAAGGTTVSGDTVRTTAFLEITEGC